LRPLSVIQVKLREDDTAIDSAPAKGFFALAAHANSAFHSQIMIIVIAGTAGYILTPVVMGGGFKPSISMAISGITAEILLMRSLYNLSTSYSKHQESSLLTLILLQIIFLGVFYIFGGQSSITLIWFSSCVIYIIYEFNNYIRSKNDNKK
jgi:hypothetical protein